MSGPGNREVRSEVNAQTISSFKNCLQRRQREMDFFMVNHGLAVLKSNGRTKLYQQLTGQAFDTSCRGCSRTR